MRNLLPRRRRTDEAPTARHSAHESDEDQTTGEAPEFTRDAVDLELNIQRTHGHLAVTPQGVWAFYALGGQDWMNQPVERRKHILSATAHRWSQLAGHEIYLRGITNPFPHKAYGKRMWEDYPNHLPDRPAARTWKDIVDAAQIHTIRLGARSSEAVLGVRLSDYAKIDDEHLALLTSPRPLNERMGEVEKLRRKLREVTDIIRKDGFNGHPLDGRSLAWLIHASVGLGAPVPATLLGGAREGWANESIPGFTSPVYPTSAPYSRSVRLRTLRESVEHERHVVVLHGESWDERHDPASGTQLPSLAFTQTFPFEVQYVYRGLLVPGRDLAAESTLDRRKAKNIAAHHEEHDDDAPAEIKRGIARAREVEDEVSSGKKEIATRFRGIALFAVYSEDEDDALEQAATLTVDAADKQGMTLVHDYGQFAYYRAFIPGEPVPMNGHITQQPAYFLATAVPNISTRGGDASGMLIGNIAGGHDVFRLDPFGGARRNTSNVMAFLGEQGAGKSSLAGAVADFVASAGIRTVCYDPSGPWAALTQTPHMRQDSRHLDLTSARPGTLVPHLMIPEPRREDHADEDEFTSARQEAKSERMELCIDAFRELLPYRMVSNDATGSVAGSIEQAVTEIGGDYGTDPWKIVDRLESLGETGKLIAQRLRDRAKLKDGALVFPVPGAEVDDEYVRQLMEQATLTVITMTGLTLPPKNQPDRSMWDRKAQQSVPILHLGSHFANRVIYADKRPKCVMSDELGISTGGTSAFGSFVTRASFDSRKWQALVGLVMQNPNILTALDDQISNLIGSAWVGHMSEEAARASLPLLRLKEDSGYHETIQGLEQGEFMVRDWTKRVRKVRVDRDWWHQDLLDALDTTPEGEGSYRETLDGEFAGQLGVGA